MTNEQAWQIRNWQNAHPETTAKLREAQPAIDSIYCDLLEEIAESAQNVEGSWDTREFIDTYGSRLAQMQGIAKVVFELGADI